MARMGRPPKSAKLKLVQGTFRPEREKVKRKRAPAAPGKKCPPPPSILGDVAKAEWKRIAPGLFKRGLLTHDKTMSLAAYCDAYANWKECSKVVADMGRTFMTEKGYVCQRPEAAMAQKERADMIKYGALFGLNAADDIPTEDEKPATDPTEDFLFGKRTG